MTELECADLLQRGEYPKTLIENVDYRTTIIGLCEKKDLGPEYAAAVWKMCEESILFFFNVFCWTQDTRTENKDLPFITFPFQDEAILEVNRCIDAGENLFIDKSRDMGVTYIVIYTFLWRWLFKRSEQFRIGSRKEDFVDRQGDMDTLFEKLRYSINFLPFWLLPKGFNKKKHSTYMKLLNPEIGCAIIGEATNADFARGGRPKAVLFDEFSAWDMAEEAWRSASDATRCKIAVGTPKGAGNKFAELSRTDEVKNKLHLLWWKHPNKAVTSAQYLELKSFNGEIGEDQSKAPVGCYIGKDGKIHSEWYDNECANRKKEDAAENLDCDYLNSGRPVFDTAKCVMAMERCVDPVAQGDLMWKVRPIFNEQGDCINDAQLDVELVKNMNGVVRVWEKPKDGFENGYVIAADTAEGLEQGDYDDARVLLRTEMKPRIVAVLHGHLKIHEYAEELAKLAVYYKRAYVNIERNNHGHGVILQLFRIYKKIWHKEVFGKGYPELSDKLGFSTGSQTKPIIIGTLGKAISEESFVDPDREFWKETLTFVEDDGKMEAQGKHLGQRCFDDRVMSQAILLWTHLNMPLPAEVRNRIELSGWRAAQRKKENENSLIRFTV